MQSSGGSSVPWVSPKVLLPYNSENCGEVYLCHTFYRLTDRPINRVEVLLPWSIVDKTKFVLLTAT